MFNNCNHIRSKNWNPVITGYFYNWYAVGTGLLAPIGTHVPTTAENETLRSYLGGTSVAGVALKEVGTSHWLTPNTGATNSSGFTAIPLGTRNEYGTSYSRTALFGFWTATAVTTAEAYNGIVYYNNTLFNATYGSKKGGWPVRVLLDDPGSWTPGDTITDYDGNVYETVQIGTQVWALTCLCVTTYNEGTPIPKVTGDFAWSILTTGAYCSYNDEF